MIVLESMREREREREKRVVLQYGTCLSTVSSLLRLLGKVRGSNRRHLLRSITFAVRWIPLAHFTYLQYSYLQADRFPLRVR